MTAAVKRLQVLIPASAPVWVTLTDGECLLAGGSQHDTGNDAIAASWDGEPVRMSFNPRYLLDGLSAAGGTVRFSVAGPKAPVFLSRSPADEQDEETRAFRYLLMPLKKPGQEPPE
jgi:DNA polymerase-3 subunit beta